jgi:hypothetical protein
MLRPGSVGSNTAADHLTLLDAAVSARLVLDRIDGLCDRCAARVRRHR